MFILTIFKYLGKGEKVKNKILFTAILLLGLSMIAIAQEPISIRSQSLGNVIEDDWDLIYDPIELRYVNGTYFFTNLADFNEMDGMNDNSISLRVSSKMDIPNNSSGYPNDFSKELPIGLAFKNPIFGFLKHAFLLRLKNSKVAENANGGDGEYEYNSSNYYDGDNDGLYDTKILSSGKYINYDIDRRTALVLNNNLKMGPMTFGWKLVSDHQFSEDDEAQTGMGVSGFGDLLHGASGVYWIWDSLYGQILVGGYDYGFDESTSHYLMEDDYSDYTSSENGSFLTTEEDSYVKSHMALMMDLGLELRADLINQTLLDGRIETNDYYSGDYTKYFDAEDMQNFETGTITETYKRLIGGDGAVHKLGGSVKGVFDKRDERKNDGFWQFGAMLGTSLGNYESSSNNQLDWTKNRVYGDTTNSDLLETYAEYYLVSDVGDYDGSSMDIFGRLNVPIGEFINLGIGGFYNYNKTTRNTGYISETTTATEYIYNGSFNDSQDYTITANSKLVADRTYETQYAAYRIPVGLEFRMPKDDLTENDPFSLRNFSFRIGTTFISSHTSINDKHQITDSHPQITTTVYGDGNVNIDINENYYKSTSIRTENIIGEKQFSAGIGYRHSENLQIDLGGYGGEDVFFVGISFTVKLDIIEKPINPPTKSNEE